jgi:hypothetical protein
MKRYLVLGATVALTLTIGSAAYASGSVSRSNAQTRPTPTGGLPGPYARRTPGARTTPRVATAMPGRTAVAGATSTTRTGVGVGTGTTGTTGVGVTTGVRSSTGAIPVQVAPVVPGSATNVGTTFNGSTPTVTYRVGSSYYHVTYLPSGRYSYSVNGSPNTFSVSGTFAGGGGISTTGGTSVLPRTGGGNAPSFPSLPAVIGLTLATVGVLARRFKRP